MIGQHDSEVVRVVAWTLVPFILLFGLYVVAHGHYGPGGGFAGAVVLAVGVVLVRISASAQVSESRFPHALGPAAALGGMGAFVLIGLLPMLWGGAFLDYAAVEGLELPPPRLRYLGILAVELAIAAAIFGALVWAFDALVGRRS